MFCQSQEKILEKKAQTSTFSWKVFQRIAEVNSEWDAISTHSDSSIFLQSEYLLALEQAPPKGVSFLYIVLMQDQTPKAIFYFQYKKHQVSESLQESPNAIKQFFTNRLSFNTLCSGNLIASGENAFAFEKSIEKEKHSELYHNAIEEATNYLAQNDFSVGLWYLKDFSNGINHHIEKQLKKNAFHPFFAQPFMKLEIRNNWKTFEDYLADLNSKCRTRAKRTFKKVSELKFRELLHEELPSLKNELYRLYIEVSKGADFNTFEMHPDYLIQLTILEKKYRIFGYFDNDKLVGFFTLIQNGSEAEAHILGLEHKYNATHQLYLDMLYKIIAYSIESGYRHLNFARTAMEIKSSVGALPKDMTIYLKANCTVFNNCVPSIYDWLYPTVEWTTRHPFKDSPHSDHDGIES